MASVDPTFLDKNDEGVNSNDEGVNSNDEVSNQNDEVLNRNADDSRENEEISKEDVENLDKNALLGTETLVQDHQNVEETTKFSFCDRFTICLTTFLLFLVFPVSIFFSIKLVYSYEQAVILRLGKLQKKKGPGIILINPCLDKFSKLDLRVTAFTTPIQETTSRDCINVRVDATVYYRIVDPVKAVCEVSHYERSLSLLAAAALRNAIIKASIEDILSGCDEISQTVQSKLDTITRKMGINVDMVKLGDVKLPEALQTFVLSEAKITGKAKTQEEMAKEEEKTAHALSKTSKILSRVPEALQLRYLQSLESMSENKNTTIIFPLPMEFLKQRR